MLTEVEVATSWGSLLTMPLADISDGIVVAGIEGLDPVKATLITSSSAGQNGTTYQSSSTDDRNIKIKLEMHPNEILQSVATIRARLYEFFMPQSPVKLTFRTEEGLDVDVYGRVESFDNDHFSAEPAVDISIICFDADFVDPTLVVVSGSSVNDVSTFTIDYPGTVKTSIKFDLMLNRDLTEFTVYSTMPDGTPRTLDFAAAMLNLDHLAIDSKPGAKTVTQYRGGSIFANPVYGVSPQSSWLELNRGTNVFRVYAAGAPIPYTISYYVKYGAL